jgi:hypothetical protein
LPNAKLIWHSRLRSRWFNPMGSRKVRFESRSPECRLLCYYSAAAQGNRAQHLKPGALRVIWLRLRA